MEKIEKDKIEMNDLTPPKERKSKAWLKWLIGFLIVVAIIVGWSLSLKYEFNPFKAEVVKIQKSDTVNCKITWVDSLWLTHYTPGVYIISGIGHYEDSIFKYDPGARELFYVLPTPKSKQYLQIDPKLIIGMTK
ncbi:MAG: hypothetical protein H8E51_07115 [Bacteroidetes bacterium]|nr:hypothetical protein [Bacteroidota bacterium]